MKRNIFRSIAAVVLLAVMMFGLFVIGQVPQGANASTVIGYQTVAIAPFTGANSYTTTQYSTAYLAGSFGKVVFQVTSDISGTANITVTPQFSSDIAGCSSVTNWAGASTSGVYVTGETTATLTAAYSHYNVTRSLSGDGSFLLEAPTQGRCIRLKVEGGSTYTPTVVAWMVNTQ